MTSFRARDVSLTAVLMLCAAGAAWAQERGGGRGGDRAQPAFEPRGFGGRSDAADAVRRAQAESGGRVLGAERVQFDGRDIMRVKVMDQNGRVRYMDSDPSSRRDTRRGGDGGRDDMPSLRPRGDNPPRP